MNRFAALQISDDEEEFTTTPSSNQQKPVKKSTFFVIQPINRESRPNKPRSKNQKMLQNNLLKNKWFSLKELKKTQERKDIMR